MAQATTQTQTKTIKTYTLTLTEKEAAVLFHLVGSIGGSTENSLRKYTSEIYHALLHLDTPSPSPSDALGLPCYVTFKDGSDSLVSHLED